MVDKYKLTSSNNLIKILKKVNILYYFHLINIYLTVYC